MIIVILKLCFCGYKQFVTKYRIFNFLVHISTTELQNACFFISFLCNRTEFWICKWPSYLTRCIWCPCFTDIFNLLPHLKYILTKQKKRITYTMNGSRPLGPFVGSDFNSIIINFDDWIWYNSLHFLLYLLIMKSLTYV